MADEKSIIESGLMSLDSTTTLDALQTSMRYDPRNQYLGGYFQNERGEMIPTTVYNLPRSHPLVEAVLGEKKYEPKAGKESAMNSRIVELETKLKAIADATFAASFARPVAVEPAKPAEPNVDDVDVVALKAELEAKKREIQGLKMKVGKLSKKEKSGEKS